MAPKKSSKSATKAPKKTKGAYKAVALNGQALVVVEAPGKVSKIQGYLGPNYIVKASVGHIMDLPKKGLGIDVDNNYACTYDILENKTDVVDELKDISKQVTDCYLCSDPDREGEFISYSVAMQLKRSGLNFHRVTYNAITKQAIQTAFQNPRTLDKDLVRAQQSRRVLDRLVGFKASPLLWSTIKMGLSAGRVQSVALRLIVDRQEEIDAFKPRDYWTIKANLKTLKGEPVVAELATEFDTEAEAAAVVAQLTAGKFKVKNVDTKTRTRAPSPPFTTPQLIQQASTVLGWGAKRTNHAAQQLYESAHVTYIRTDSTFVDPSAVTAMRAHLQAIGPRYCPAQANSYKSSASAQEAHEAIRPTDLAFTPAMTVGQLPPDCQTLYELIYKRAVASQSVPAEFKQVVATIENGNFELSAKGQTLIFDGFLKFWTYSDSKELELPPMAAGDFLTSDTIDNLKHTTKPPARFNTASIVKELEENGVGRPSTYQSIIDTLSSRSYITEEGKAFIPTPIGKEVIKILKQYAPRVVDIQFTADMEAKLDEVASGKLDWVQAIDIFWKPLEQEIKNAQSIIVKNEVETDKKCLKCGKALMRKVSRAGPFYCCSDREKCGATYQIGADETPVERVVEYHTEVCKTCGGKMVKRYIKLKPGQFFFGCANYDTTGCKVTLNADGVWNLPSALQVVGKCDKCGKGDMVVRKNHKGQDFQACNKFPKCRNAKPWPEKTKAP